jgi:ParB family chromosome partitioning protein
MSTTQKKNVLGRGLNALIPKQPRIEVSIKGDSLGRDTGEIGIIASVDVARVQTNPFQPRTDFDQSALEELKQSIVEKGVIQPITVRRVPEGYQIVSGERRLRAAQLARLKQIPAYIINVATDEEMLELALIENIQREHLNPIEIATAYQRLMDECQLSQEAIAHKVGKERSTVTNFIRLLKLPTKIQDGLRKGKIQMGHARALINVPSEKTQLRVFDRIVDDGWSVRKVEDFARISGKSTPKTSKAPQNSPTSNTQNAEAKLRELLGTKVSVRSKGAGRGEIVVEYYSLDDFDRLMELFGEGSKDS